MTASGKRILMAGWESKAYCTMIVEVRNSFRYWLFQKSGYLLTADSSDDGIIQPEDLKDY